MNATPPALVLFSHGSLLCGSGQALQAHAQNIRDLHRYAAVEIGYLNYNQPSIEEAVARCRAAGAREIVIVPYFLVAGKFVTVDLPARLKDVLAQNPDLLYHEAKAIEAHPKMLELVEQSVAQQRDPAIWQAEQIEQARTRCTLRPDCPLYGSLLCRAHPAVAEAKTSADGLHETAPSGIKPDPDSFRGAGGKAILMVLHGSPRAAANKPALAIARALEAKLVGHRIVVAYLECNQPSLQDALSQLGAADVAQVSVVPYFLHPGRHLILDIGNALLESRARYPGMGVTIGPYTGELPGLRDILLDRAAEAF